MIVAGVACEPLLLESRVFREYVVRAVVQKLNRVSGGKAEIARIELESWPLTARFHDITLHGKENQNSPPLLHVDKVTVRLSILSLLRQKLKLDDLLIEHPVVHLVAGNENNISQFSIKSSGDQKAAVDLSVGHLLLSKGEISYQDKSIPLDGDLYDLGINVQSDGHAWGYRGSISYQNARLHYLKYGPVRHSLIVKFNTAASHISVESLRATVGSSTLSLRGEMNELSSPSVAADYDVRIHPQDFAQGSQLTVAGDILVFGKLNYRHATRRPWLLNLSLDGQVTSEPMTGSFHDTPVQIPRLQARYRLGNGTFQAQSSVTGLRGGQATISLEIQHVDTTPNYRIAASFREISLEEVQQAVRGRQPKRVALVGRIDGTAEAAWSGTMRNVISHCDLLIRPAPDDATHEPQHRLPVEGAIHLTYSWPEDVITLRETTLRISSISVAIQGRAGDRSALQIHATAPDIRELAGLIGAIRSSQADLSEMSGAVELSATMEGSLQKPRLIGHMSGSNLRVRASQWSTVRAVVEVSPSALVLHSASLVSAREGKAWLTGSVVLRDWSYSPSNPTRVSLAMQRLRVADLQGAANLNYPISGDLSGELKFHGTELDPAGSGNVKILNARIYGERLEKTALEVRAEHGTVKSTINIGTSAGSATVNLSYVPATRSYDLQLSAPSVVLEELHAVRERSLPLSGVAKVSAAGQGTLDKPQFTATVDLPEGEVRQNTVTQLRADIRVVNQHVEFELTSRIAEGSVQAHGQVNLTGDYYCDAAMDTSPLHLKHLLPATPPNSQNSLQAQTELHASLRGPLRKSDQLEGRLTISAMSASYESLQISAARPIQVDYAHSALNIPSAEFRGSGTSVRVQGSIPLTGMSLLSLNAEGHLDASLLRILKSDLKSSGELSFEAHTTGSIKNPSIRGQVQLRDFALSSETSPLGIENLSASLDIENNRLRISSFSGKVGGGELALAGSVLYWPVPQFDLTVRAKSVRLRYPTGLRMLLDSDLALTGKLAASILNGRFLIDDLSFTPEFDLATLGRSFAGPTVQHQPGFGDSIKLAVAVQSKRRLSATSSLASAEGDVNLRIIGTVANPVIVGRTDLTSGEVLFRNRRYQFERGIVVFSDPNNTRPAVDISATTTVQQYNLTLSLRGYLDKLNMSYTSDPPLPTADIINLIAVGRTTQEGNAASHGTDSILASQAANRFSTGMQSLTGISGLRIDPLVGGSNRDPSARIAIQQRVTKNFIFTFSTDVSQPGEETVEGKYQINKRWSIGVSRDPVGGIAVDGRYHTKF